jgi:hypothetical protein
MSQLDDEAARATRNIASASAPSAPKVPREMKTNSLPRVAEANFLYLALHLSEEKLDAKVLGRHVAGG